MEKFAVDLDKVLDDFEFNEDRAEQLASVPPKKPPPPQLSNQHRPPTTPYRRPQFEPINMAEADYAAAPERSYQSRWRSTSPTPDPGQWDERNSLLMTDDEDEDEENDSEDEIRERERERLDVPKNVNESVVGLYGNNSFQDEFLERGRPNASDGVSDSKWPTEMASNLTESASNRDNSGLNDYSNAGTGLKGNAAKDVKTVSNNLACDKVKNLDKNASVSRRSDGERNLPDVASTSERPATTAVMADVANNTFDLVTNLRYKDQSAVDRSRPEAEMSSAVSSVETSEEEFDSESAEADNVRAVPSVASNSNPEAANNNETIPSAGTVTQATPKPAEVKSLFSFTEMDHLSDSDLLSYLQEIEDEAREKEEATASNPEGRLADNPAVADPGPRISIPLAPTLGPAMRASDRSAPRRTAPDLPDLDELVPAVDLEKHAIFERQVESVPATPPAVPRGKRAAVEDFTEAVVESSKSATKTELSAPRKREPSLETAVTDDGLNENLASLEDTGRVIPATDKNVAVAGIPIGQKAKVVAANKAAIGQVIPEPPATTSDRTSSVGRPEGRDVRASMFAGVGGQTGCGTSSAIGGDIPTSSAIGRNTSATDLISHLVPLERMSLRDTSLAVGPNIKNSVSGLGVVVNSAAIGPSAETRSAISRNVAAESAVIGSSVEVTPVVDASASARLSTGGNVATDGATIGANGLNVAVIGGIAPAGSAIGPREPVFEMSLPECQRQSETEDSSPEDEESMEDAGAGGAAGTGAFAGASADNATSGVSVDPGASARVSAENGAFARVLAGTAAFAGASDDVGEFAGVSAETGDVIQLKPDLDRPGFAVDEVRSPMIQSPRDGSTIHVLGEEERPTRPKYLLLSSLATSDDGGHAQPNIGPPGSTPSTTTANQNARNHALDNRASVGDVNMNVEADEGTDNALNDNAANDNAANDNAANDNAANDNAANDNVAAEQDPVTCADTLPPDPSALDTLTPEERSLGKLPPFWIPDQEAPACMSCDLRFTVIKRRHHCRACGKVLCSKCCALKFRLEYMDSAEGRVCPPCYHILLKVLAEEEGECAGGEGSPGGAGTPLGRQPNPNNPMEYCSTVPPLQQLASGGGNPPSVLVPVLKREGSARPKGEAAKQVMFSDGIRPGGDLTELDGSAEPRLPFRRPGRVAKRVSTPPGGAPTGAPTTLPPLDPKTHSYIRADGGVPPVATTLKGELTLDDSMSSEQLMASLRSEAEPPVTFALNRNLFVQAKIINLTCCVNRECWSFATQGLSSVGQDEVMFVLETTEDEASPPADVFTFVNSLYQDAVRGSSVSEMGCTLLSNPFLGSAQHGAFLYIRPSFQCLAKLIVPAAPYLVVLLVHRAEVPWARVFPIRLLLRLGAELRYYPCSLVSVRDRRPVYRAAVGHTIMNVLADLRNMTYTLPAVRGLVVHMEDRQTSVLLPRNRYDQVTRAINNSNEHVLALAANLSLVADSHLVCVQSEEDDSYHTQAINIHNKPRRVTGASYVVFNGALKTSSNLTAKSSIVEDGLMVQITPDTMLALRAALRNMKDFSIGCGPAGADPPDETVVVKWVDDDKLFNVGVVSAIDGRCLDGVPSIRVHNGTDYMGRTRLVRWTEVFILQSEESGSRTQDPVDVGRLSESIARATCQALVKLLDLLAQAAYTRLAVRATIHPDNVGYEVGSRGERLPPIYMNSLDNELVPVLHTAAAANEHADAVLELVFHVLLQ